MPALSVWVWFRVLVLPLLLVGATAALLGTYYESNDDYFMELLLRGTSAVAPVGNLHLWWHGWGYLLAAAFGAAPAVPWYGLLCYGLTVVALMGFFYALEVVAQRIGMRAVARLSVELLVFATAFVYNVVQMNFTRPALLLGAAAGLVALAGIAARPVGEAAEAQPGLARARRDPWLLGLPLLLAAWLVRPDGALFGLALVLPLGLLLPRRPVLVRAGSLLMVAAVAYIGLAATRTPAGNRYRQMNADRARVVDYHNFNAHLRTPADSLAFTSLTSYWGMADTALINPRFYRVALPIDPTLSLVHRRSLNELVPVVTAIAYRWFAAFALLLFVAATVWHRAVPVTLRGGAAWLFYNLYFWAVFVAITLFLHMVPRIFFPSITVYAVVNFLFVAVVAGPVLLPAAQSNALWYRLGAIGAVAALVLHSFLLGRFVREQSVLQRTNEQYLTKLAAATERKVVVNEGMFIAFDALCPLRCYRIAENRKLLMLTGWTAFDPSHSALCTALTGRSDLAGALQVLVRRPNVAWVLPDYFVPFFTSYWQKRCFAPAVQSWTALPGPVPTYFPRLYQPQERR